MMVNGKEFLSNGLSQYEILRDIGKALSSSLEMNEVLKMIMDFIGKYYKPSNWSLLLVDEEKFDLFFVITVGDSSDKIKDKRLKIGDGIAGWSVKKQQTVTIKNAYEDKRFHQNFDKQSGFKTDTIICVPLLNKGKALGVIELVNVDLSLFEEPYLDLLESLADFAAIALGNARYLEQIKELSVRDDCTKLFNSRYMVELFDMEINRSRRHKYKFSAVFLDLDHFKNVNDNYGHLIGSQLLRNIADILQSSIRKSDWAIRYGGDEFVLILTETGKKEALHLTERIRNRLNKTVFFSEENYNIKITASFGIAVYPDDAETTDELIGLADHAMYKVKNSGRNNILIAEKEKNFLKKLIL